MKDFNTIKTNNWASTTCSQEVKKYNDLELNNRIAKAKRKAVDKFIKNLGYTSDEDLRTALQYQGKKELMETLVALQLLVDQQKSILHQDQQKLFMYECNIDPLFFEFILYQLRNESDLEIFKTKLLNFIENHPQYAKANAHHDDFHPFLLLYKNK